MSATVFVSYSHQDGPQYMEELRIWLEPLAQESIIDLWDDTRIAVGEKWRQEIEDALESARLIILMLSPSFLASAFIRQYELPAALKAAEDRGAVIAPVILKNCWLDGPSSFLKDYQFVNPPSDPLYRLDEAARANYWMKLCNAVNKAAGDPAGTAPARRTAPQRSAADGRRRALLIVNDGLDPSFEVPIPRFDSLFPSKGPAADLAGALGNPKIGDYKLTTAANAGRDELLGRLQSLFRDADEFDHILLYIYGLAVKHEEMGLGFVLRETRPGVEASTILWASDIRGAMTGRTLRNFVMIADCRFGCAMAATERRRDLKIYADIAGFQGEGRFILAGDDAPRFSWIMGEGRPAPPAESPAAWLPIAGVLADSLWTGKADVDGNRIVTVGELFGFLEGEFDRRDDGLRPVRWLFDKSRSDLKIAQVWSTVFNTPTVPVREGVAEKLNQTSLGLDVPDLRQPVLDLIAPAYLLDSNYVLLDWNPAFDLLVAEPLGLVRRRDSATAFVDALSNNKAVVQRYLRKYPDGVIPAIDSEPLVYLSDVYGELKFQKISSQVSCDDGTPKGYVVFLNLLSADKEQQLWDDLTDHLAEMVSTSQYAMVYDRLLLNFPEYLSLVAEVADRLGPSAETRRVVDCGSGTGNGALHLLRTDPNREVWAVECNETMLQIFRRKIEEARSGGEKLDVENRLSVVKDDILRLDALEDGSFDGVLMTNVLYDVRDPDRCLRQANRVLKRGGVLALSTPSDQTDVGALLGLLKQRLAEKGLLPSLDGALWQAQNRHRIKHSDIHRDSVERTIERLRRAGFRIDGAPATSYVGSVVVIRAVKVRESFEADLVDQGPPAPAVLVPTPARVDTPASHDVFLCHSSRDREIVLKILAASERAGIRCWFANQDQVPGDNYVREVTRAITSSRILMIVLSENSVVSEHAVSEVTFAKMKKIPVVPIRLADVQFSDELAYLLHNVHWLDAFPPPIEDHLPRVMTTLKTVLGKLAGDAAASSPPATADPGSPSVRPT